MTDKPETVADVAVNIRRAVEYIEKQYPGTKTLDAAPILRSMKRWASQIERAMAASAVPVARPGVLWKYQHEETGRLIGTDEPPEKFLPKNPRWVSCFAPAVPVESPPASVPDGFYLASFKHATRNGAVVWWQPDNAGYTPDLEQAGIYTEITPGYHDSEHTVPVPVRFLARCRIRRTIDPGDLKNRAFWSAADLRAAIATTPEESP